MLSRQAPNIVSGPPRPTSSSHLPPHAWRRAIAALLLSLSIGAAAISGQQAQPASAPAQAAQDAPAKPAQEKAAQGAAAKLAQGSQAKAAAAAPAAPVEPLKLPNKEGSTKFLVIGDSGTGDRPQIEVGAQIAKEFQRFKFDFAIMLGDNMYGAERPEDFVRKFEQPYKVLLDAGVKFYASLGNHDDPNQRFYKPFNMGGERYYTYTKGPIRFFVLDSNYMDEKQREWVEKELKSSNDAWKIPYFHHPLYSSGARHGSEVDLREQVEPLFLKYGVSVVFAGHEHFYERLQPQKGITYFTSGGAAKLRKGNIRKGPMTAVGFDTDRSFMLVEIDGDELYFQTFSRIGKTVDSGTVTRVKAPPAEAAAAPAR
jgi:predicted phosphodiesterase